MIVEFDSAKNRSKKEKHGIDFIEAQRLWEDPDRAEVKVFTMDEPRSLVIGKINGRHWTAVITVRGTKIRIISVRCSRKNEVAIYEGNSSQGI